MSGNLIAASLLALLLLATPAHAQGTGVADAGTIAIRTGSHPGYGRIVFDAPPNTRYRLTREGNRIVVRFPDEQTLAAPNGTPRNVSGLGVAGSRLEFSIPPGAGLRETRLGQRLVIDVTDPPTVTRTDDPADRDRDAASHAQSDDRPKPTRSTAPTTADANARPPRARSGSASTERKEAAGRPAGPGSTEPAVAAAPPPVPREPPQATGKANVAAVPVPAPQARGATPAAAEPSPTPAPPVPPTTDSVPEATAETTPTERRTPAGDQSGPVVATVPRIPVLPDRAAGVAESAPVFSTPTPSLSVGPAPQPAPTAGPLQSSGPVALVVRRLPAANPEQSAILIPFPDTTGSAMLQRDSATLIVFNERRPIDLVQLRDDPVFGQTTAHVLPNATMLRLRLPEGRSATLTSTPQGWRVMLSHAVTRDPPIATSFADGRVAFAVATPTSVVTLRDPDSGVTMLIGTVGRAGGAITTERRTVEFVLHPTQRGIAVEALSDTLALRTVPTGFQLTGPPDGLALSPPAAMTDGMLAAARLTRRFRFPAMTTEGLARRVNAHVLEAAAMPPLARGPARKIAAESMIALGMAAEAEALLRVIVEQDPKEAAATDTSMLRAVAALLNGRTGDARALAEPRAAGTDEDALWRGLLLATRQEGSPEAAQLLSSTAPLLLMYPPALRDRLLPRAVETLVLGGALPRATELLAERPKDPGLRMARAFAHQMRGETDAALALLDEETASRDQLNHARAAIRAVEVRLASGALEPAAAADALDRLLYAWRGDWRDLALRRRIAELRQHTGAWRTALSVLRDAASDFPAQAAQIRAWQQSAFAELVHGDALERMDPMQLIGLVEENTDLLPAEEGGDRLRDRLADRLIALDLPKRADVVLARLMQTAPTEFGRATYGTRLARLRLREGDAEGVLSALGQSTSQDLPSEMREQRLLLAAGAAARMGNPKGAINALNGLDSAAADELRATVHEQSGDWAGAKRSLASLVRRVVPVVGDLDEAQRRLILRLATAAARVGDGATLASLRDRDTTRMGSGPLGDMFRLLTAEPIRGTSDLGRARQEAELVSALPAGLAALRGSPPTE